MLGSRQTVFDRRGRIEGIGVVIEQSENQRCAHGMSIDPGDELTGNQLAFSVMYAF